MSDSIELAASTPATFVFLAVLTPVFVVCTIWVEGTLGVVAGLSLGALVGGIGGVTVLLYSNDTTRARPVIAQIALLLVGLQAGLWAAYTFSPDVVTVAVGTSLGAAFGNGVGIAARNAIGRRITGNSSESL